MTSSSSFSSRPRPSCVVQEQELPWQSIFDRTEQNSSPPQPLQGAEAVAAVYNYRRKMLGQAAGAQQLGCSLMEVAAGGCTAFPYHAHAANEEAVYVLSGEGLMRMPAGDFTVKPGDYIALLTGEANAHQLWNFHSSLPLRYLCISTKLTPEVCVSRHSDGSWRCSAAHHRITGVPAIG